MGITDYKMYDVSDLGSITSQELHDCDVWAGYLSGAATHVWSDNDWKRVADFPKLPIVVARPDKAGNYCGLEALIAISKLGIPTHTDIALDMELYQNDIDAGIEFVNTFTPVLRHFGLGVCGYGSTSYLFDLPFGDGYWVATDSKIEEQYHHPGVHATQYLFGSNYDISLIHRHFVHKRLEANWGINHL